jgi:D-alanine-D-alanine ligase
LRVTNSEDSAMSDYGKVAVLMGGTSAEREISLISGKAVLAALCERGVDAYAFDPATVPIWQLRAEGFDRAFVILHGRHGEDGTVQGALELMGVPYTGSGVMASALAMDKWRSKLVLSAAGLPIPDYELLDASSNFAAVESRLGLPLFVKPGNEGSSIGITKVKDAGGLRAAYDTAAQYDKLVLAERFLAGGEYTVAIVDGRAMPAIRIVPATEFYDYDAKYFRDDTEYRIPCGLSAAAEVAMQATAQHAFAVLGCRGWARIDFMLDATGNQYVLEANTAPGMTGHSLVPMAAKAAGMSFSDLVLKILEGASLG